MGSVEAASNGAVIVYQKEEDPPLEELKYMENYQIKKKIVIQKIMCGENQ